MPEMCVIYSSNTTRNVKEGIYIHAIPYLDEKKEIMGRICLWNARELETCGRSLRSVFIEVRIVMEISNRKILANR